MSAERFARQSFLGADSQERIARCPVGVVGLGGGGSHVVQQLAHIGFQNFVLYDDDVVEDSNLNRLVGANSADVSAQTAKLQIAERMIRGVQPKAIVKGFSCRWQVQPEPLRMCPIVIGCIDGYKARDELEVSCRRYVQHYIDIGMDVHGTEKKPVIGGQVILSSPGGPCMRCMGFLTADKLAKEARGYGRAGSRPQVIWPNGVLASTAVGIAVDLVTNWTQRERLFVYLSYDGNAATLSESKTVLNLSPSCTHFPSDSVGDPVFTEL